MSTWNEAWGPTIKEGLFGKNPNKPAEPHKSEPPKPKKPGFFHSLGKQFDDAIGHPKEDGVDRLLHRKADRADDEDERDAKKRSKDDYDLSVGMGSYAGWSREKREKEQKNRAKKRAAGKIPVNDTAIRSAYYNIVDGLAPLTEAVKGNAATKNDHKLQQAIQDLHKAFGRVHDALEPYNWD